MKIVILGGFLGSGKTSVVIQLAKCVLVTPNSNSVIKLKLELGC